MAAIVHQPLDYLDAVSSDIARYFDPTFARPRLSAGHGTVDMALGRRDPPIEDLISTGRARSTAVTTLHIHASQLLTGYQSVMRVNGLVR